MDKIIFFATFVIFPFGQLFKIGIFNLFDATVLLLAAITIFKKPKYPEWYRYFLYFVTASLFSLLVSYQLFELKSLLYLVRLWSYSMVAVYLSNFNSELKSNSQRLVTVAVASAIFGWAQYLIWPDLTALKYLGWDDHLLRIVGTFLDPTYLGLILVLGIIIALRKKLNLTFYFLALSILFTYSRISYLLLFLIAYVNKRYIAIIIFILIILFLPKNIGEGTNLARTVSGNNKLINYKETLLIFKKSPVIGVGFNNICSARQYYLGDTNINSHSCSGSDSSILFILATTGVMGLILFINFIVKVPVNNLLLTSFVAVVIHSLFANSLFYPHIMFWLFSLVGLRSEINSKRS